MHLINAIKTNSQVIASFHHSLMRDRRVIIRQYRKSFFYCFATPHYSSCVFVSCSLCCNVDTCVLLNPFRIHRYCGTQSTVCGFVLLQSLLKRSRFVYRCRTRGVFFFKVLSPHKFRTNLVRCIVDNKHINIQKHHSGPATFSFYHPIKRSCVL